MKLSPPSTMFTTTTTILTTLYCLLLTTFPTTIESKVPTSNTFTIAVNQAPFAPNKAEYGATYRDIVVKTYTQITTLPLLLCFYNTTPDAYVLSVRASDRFIWEANRDRPVGEKAILSLGRDGNLLLKESDGRIVWQTNTANKNVMGLVLQSDGDLVLFNTMGRPVWKSFDHPVDTLLVGMSMDVVNGPNRLVSRRSEVDGSDGPYSLVMEEQGIVVYWNYSKNNGVRYADMLGLTEGNKVTFLVESSNSSSYNLVFQIESPPSSSTNEPQQRTYIIKTLTYDPTYSFLRLASNGNVLIFSYNFETSKWQQTYSYFPDYHIRECALPSKCGQFGLCDDGKCIACPTSNRGLVPWSDKCTPPSLARGCNGGRGRKARYFRVDGAEHFMTLLTSGEGPMSVSECGDKCGKDCECKGFVYDNINRICLRVPVLGTLIREGNSTRTSVYVKY